MHYDISIITKVMNSLGHIYQGCGMEGVLHFNYLESHLGGWSRVLDDFIP